MTFSCIRCTYKCRQLLKLLNHYKFIHSSEPNFQIACGVDNCQSTYKVVDSLKRHLQRKHPHFYAGRSRDNLGTDTGTVSVPPEVTDVEPHLDEQCDTEFEVLSNEANSEAKSVNLHKYVANFLLTLREGHLVAQST